MWWIWFILLLIVAIYMLLILSMYMYANPSQQGAVVQLTNPETKVTCLTLGQRGNLGNQMFQLANLLAIAQRSNCAISLPTQTLDIEVAKLIAMSNLPIYYTGSEDIKVNYIYYEYDNYEYIKLPADNMTYNIRGYRQAEAYFADVYPEIAQYLKPKKSILDCWQGAVNKKVLAKEYLTIHLRYGDYDKWFHKIPYCQEFYPCNLEYYRAAIQILRKLYTKEVIYVCTNDRKKAQSQLLWLDENIELAPLIDGLDPVLSDYMIMYGAVGLVMANSTFSWWAGYSSQENKQRIIMPYPWWHNQGFIGRHLELNNGYLYPKSNKYQVLSASNGQVVKVPEIPKYTETLNIVRFIRGCL